MIPEKDPTAIRMDADVANHRLAGTTWHGNIDFDVPAWSFIDTNLWQGGYVYGLKLDPVFQHVISLYPWERYAARRKLVTELYVTMYDAETQQMDQVDSLARLVNTCRETGPTLVHCQAGLNRSSLIVARALYLQGEDGPDIVKYLRAARSPACLCNPAFEEEVMSWRHTKRYITVAPVRNGDDFDVVMNLNGRPRAYYDLKQAQRSKESLSKDAVVVELDFNDQGVEGKWV